METYYFDAKDGLTVIWQLAGDGVPFKFLSRARRPMQFTGKHSDAVSAVTLTFTDAEEYRELLAGHSK